MPRRLFLSTIFLLCLCFGVFSFVLLQWKMVEVREYEVKLGTLSDRTSIYQERLKSLEENHRLTKELLEEEKQQSAEFLSLNRDVYASLEKEREKAATGEEKLHQYIAASTKKEGKLRKNLEKSREELSSVTDDKFLSKILQKKVFLELQAEELTAYLEAEKKTTDFLRQELDGKVKNLILEYENKIEELKRGLKTSVTEERAAELKKLLESKVERISFLEENAVSSRKTIDRLSEELADYKRKIDGKESWLEEMQTKYNVALNVMNMTETTIKNQGKAIDYFHRGVGLQNTLLEKQNEVASDMKEDLRLFLMTIDENQEALASLAEKIRTKLLGFDQTMAQNIRDVKALGYRSPQESVSFKALGEGHLFADRTQRKEIKKGHILSVDKERRIIYVNLGKRDGLTEDTALFVEKSGRKIAEATPLFLRDYLAAFSYALTTEEDVPLEKGDVVSFNSVDDADVPHPEHSGEQTDIVHL